MKTDFPRFLGGYLVHRYRVQVDLKNESQSLIRSLACNALWLTSWEYVKLLGWYISP